MGVQHGLGRALVGACWWLLLLGEFACAPTEVPRTAHVAAHRRFSSAIAASYMYGAGSATYRTGAASGQASGNDANPLGPTPGGLAYLAPLAMTEFSGALGVIPACEVGVGVRVLGSVRGEVRCQPIGYGHEGPVALALSGGGGVSSGVSPYVRAGADLTLGQGTTEYLLAAYLRHGRTTHSLAPSGLPVVEDTGHCCSVGLDQDPYLAITQTETRFSIPVGIALRIKHSPEKYRATRLVLGLVPSFVVLAGNQKTSCEGCASKEAASRFSEAFALTATVGLEWNAFAMR